MKKVVIEVPDKLYDDITEVDEIDFTELGEQFYDIMMDSMPCIQNKVIINTVGLIDQLHFMSIANEKFDYTSVRKLIEQYIES